MTPRLIKRRTFLIGSAAVIGGVAFGYRAIEWRAKNPLEVELDRGRSALTPYVIIDQSGVTIIAPRAEMGQGIHTTLAAMVAEELDVPLGEVKVEHGPASEVYSNTFLFGTRPPKSRWRGLIEHVTGADQQWNATQLTGGQTSVQDGFVKMRKAGAAARMALLEAAAKHLDVEAASLTTDRGAVVQPGGTRIPYSRLAQTAADIEPPQDPPLKPRAQWRLLGKPSPRVDMLAKCTGRAEYAIDVRLPGMLHGVVRRNPRLGGVMRGFDAAKAERMPGVKRIVPIETGVIVVATNTWYALEAAKTVEFDWGPAPYPDSGADHRRAVEEALENGDVRRPRDEGDVDRVLAESALLEGEYRVPYLAHATMEPLSAVALLRNGRLDIWAGTQFPTMVLAVGARIAGVSRADVKAHTTYMGGGFGRRLETDFVETAVHAAVAMQGTPVKVTWSREEDMSHDVYRPLAMARFRASVSDGRPTALDLRVSSPPLFASYNARNGGIYKNRADLSIDLGASEQPYEIANYRVTAHAAPRLLPVGWWRSVGESQNAFFHESIMDELAHAAGADPLTMRLELLTHAPSRKVLEAVAEMSNWGSRLPHGHARGVAYVLSSGAATAEVVEIRDTDAGIEILNAYVAVDVGIALDPRNIEAQLQSGLLFGLTAATMGEITVTNGAVDQSNFHDYPLMRMYQTPSIEVRIHQSGERMFGVGEGATPAAAPALGNAIFAATGRRVRELPFGKFVRFA